MHAATAVRTNRAPHPRWRLAVLIFVLAGFFLMHGLSSVGTCVSAAPSLSASAQSTTAMASTSAMAGPATTKARTAPEASTADQCCAAMGAQCVPLRPQDTAWLLVLLLFGLAVLPTAGVTARVIDAPPGTTRAGRRYPSKTTPVRLLGCVSLT